MLDPVNAKNFPGTRYLGTVTVPSGPNVQGQLVESVRSI
jgi:hypothetical protein